MTINVHIEHIVLDGIGPGDAGPRVFNSCVAQAVAAQLAQRMPDLRRLVDGTHVPNQSFALSMRSGPAALGAAQLADPIVSSILGTDSQSSARVERNGK